jgi:DNA invertase Pin-like site-specific DNA recombinase
VKVLGYVRVSTAEQGEAGISLEAQRARLEAHACAQELELVDVVEEIASAKSLKKRSRLAEALERVKSGEVDGLLVAKLDRLTRRVLDLGTLLEDVFARAALLSVSDSIDTRSAAGRLVLHVLMSVAQWERESTAERTREVAAHLKSKGRYLAGGRVPYGMRRGPERDPKGRLIISPNVDELRVLQLILDAKARKLTCRQIAEELNEQGIRNRRGKEWMSDRVNQAIRHAELVREHLVLVQEPQQVPISRMTRALSAAMQPRLFG